MRKISIIILASIALTVITSAVTAVTAYGEDINTDTHDIVITTEDNALSVKESLTIRGTSNETYGDITIWVMDDAHNVNVLVGVSKVSPISIGNERYTCNISSFNINKNSSIQLIISYTLDKDVEKFEKTITRNTTAVSVKFDKSTIYTGKNLAPDTSFTLCLYEPTEAPISGYIIVFILLLIALLVVSALYTFRRQRSSKIRDASSESKELLNTKKALLISVLKDIEKQHRSKQISDDTYHKLKESYKQQAVETMKKLGDTETLS